MGRSVILHIQVRRFKYLNPRCPRTTFVEPIEALAPAKQRRTVGFYGASSAIAQALGGSAAARLSTKLGLPTSRDTLLRALRRLGRKVTMSPPVVIGIDDWAITTQGISNQHSWHTNHGEAKFCTQNLFPEGSSSIFEPANVNPTCSAAWRSFSGATSVMASARLPSDL
jgi:hypothetical protein